ncbi:hypothetical protein V5799_027717 [Amblyomma americanum]|uniref:Uncharacterized protein n=1 Tax=Amblyomma americanum TaxID=6943 RepID=A0AAQ4DEY0_AMBAM
MDESDKETTACAVDENLSTQQTPSKLDLLGDAVVAKAITTPNVDAGSSARTAGFVLRHPPKVMPSLNGIDKGLSSNLVKIVTAENDAVDDELVKAPDEVACPIAPDGGALPETKKVEDKPLTEEVQTCISRAAHKAEAKMNALKAAAALLKENSQSEKDTKETGGLSVTLRASRISCRSNSEGSADKRPQKTTPSQGDLAPKNDVPASKPPTRAVTPPLPVIPSYLTLSKSHPSLFHASPRKRGRPKLATVNSLNEEIERAHMARSSELAATTTTDRSKPPPVIPVITSLKIKPIPPPPPHSDAAPLSSPTAPREQPELRPRSRSQGDVSEEKSDAEDSIGRRKSKRKRGPAELKTMVTQLKELSLEKGLAATQEPLQTLAGGTPGSKPPEQGQEKITLRVTRDEKCNLKVEKQLRPAVVSETLHDSGFCEDVVAESSVPSPVPDTKQKGELAGAAAKAGQLPVHQDMVSSTSKGLEQIVASRHIHHGTRKDLRKSKRKSVEEWVNEQSKWVRTHEVETVKHQGIVPPPSTKTTAGTRDTPSKPGASVVPKEAPIKVQRRGRKRTNPVKIEKPAPLADAQQENSASASLQVSSSSTEPVTPSTQSPVEKEAGTETASRNSSHSPKGSSKGRQELDHPKKSPELVIPRGPVKVVARNHKRIISGVT